MVNFIQSATLRLPAACWAQANEVFGELPRIYAMTAKQERLLNKFFDKLVLPVSLPGADEPLMREFCQQQAFDWFILLAKAGKKAMKDNPITILESYSKTKARSRLVFGELANIMRKIDDALQRNKSCLKDPTNYHDLSIDMLDCWYDMSNWHSVGATGKGILERELEKFEDGRTIVGYWQQKFQEKRSIMGCRQTNGTVHCQWEEAVASTLKKSYSGLRCPELHAVGSPKEVRNLWEFNHWKEALPPSKNPVRWQKKTDTNLRVVSLDSSSGIILGDTDSHNPFNCVVLDLRRKELELIPLRSILSTSMTWNRKEHAHLIVAHLKHVSSSFGKREAMFSPTYWYYDAFRTGVLPKKLKKGPAKAKGQKSQISIHDGSDFVAYHTETEDKLVWKHHAGTRLRISKYFAYLADIFVGHKGYLPSPFEWETCISTN